MSKRPALLINNNILIFYKGDDYNILVKMWVPLGCCTNSPKAAVVVNDHETMSIKLRHSYVDARAGGLV